MRCTAFVFLVVLCGPASAQVKRAKEVWAYEGRRVDRLTRYDADGNEVFLFWDGETTGVRAVEYDSLNRLVREAGAHSNAGCWELKYEYGRGVKRTLRYELSEMKASAFPREKQFSVVLRKVKDIRALDALPEMRALHKEPPLLLAEEYSNDAGHPFKGVSYDPDGDTTITEVESDENGRVLRALSYNSGGDTIITKNEYGGTCQEASNTYRETRRSSRMDGSSHLSRERVRRVCDVDGNTVRETTVTEESGSVDSTVIVKRYSLEGKLIMRLNGRYDPMIPEASWEYDEHGNELKFVAYSGGGPVHLTRSYTYNERSERVEEVVTEFEQTKVLRYRYKYW